MNISYSWLKEYIDIDLTPQELADVLTQLGLEISGIEEVESIKGGLKGLVVGHVETCQPHPDSDHLSLTTVNIGEEEVLPIVCGAPNVAAGQKVIVATVGTTLYDGDNEFKIKKSKIRGEASMGMICAEDEIGVGTSHDGIMVLPPATPIGLPAAKYFNVENDFVLEIDLTPNRIDGASHIGVARDIAAYLKQAKAITYTRKSVDHFNADDNKLEIPVTVENSEACPRYCGVTLTGITVKDSPDWLKKRLVTIGQTPINNIVDVTNYVLHETGQPLHAFDADQITGGKVVVKTLPAKTTFTTLDEEERELHENDLMICNGNEGMCIAGVFGGIKSGVTTSTTNIFLESAYFNPVYVRKTARRHALNTDASFRFERGVDPNGLLYALKRAALLIKEVAGGTISSDIVDVYSDKNFGAWFPVSISYAQVKRLIGKELEPDTIKKILLALEMEIVSESADGLEIKVPPYRVDVQREADVIEDILRVYGYNNVEPLLSVNSTIQYSAKPDRNKLQNTISEMLTAQGFNEIMNNSLTKTSHYENLNSYKQDETVNIFNPLSADLNAMRQNLLFGALDVIAYNINRKNADLKLYEFGNCYFLKDPDDQNSPAHKYHEEQHLGIWLTGNKAKVNWISPEQKTTFYELKSYVENTLRRLGVKFDSLEITGTDSDLFGEGLLYSHKGGKKVIAELGFVNPGHLKDAEITQEVYYADLHWDNIINLIRKHNVAFHELPKYPEVRRDLALLLDKSVTFKQVKEIAYKVERKLLRNVDLFDVYEGDKLPAGKNRMR